MDRLEAVTKALCAERCAFYGERPCWQVSPDNFAAEDCANDGCRSMATAVIRADLCADPALLAEAVEVLRTLRDYVDDASRGHLRYRGRSDISEMAGEDLVLLDNVIAKLENRHDR